MEIVDTTPDEYLSSLADPARSDVHDTMVALDAAIVAAVPDRRRVLWQGVFWGGTDQSIIGYGDITQPRPKGGEVKWFLVGLARQKSNYSIYLNAVKDGAYLGHAYADGLTRPADQQPGRPGKVKVGSASITFTRLDVLDLEVFAEMLREADQLTPPDP